MTIDHDGHPHASSPTAHVLTELQLYGWRPFQDEPDPRPLPEAPAIGGAIADTCMVILLVGENGQHAPTHALRSRIGVRLVSRTCRRRASRSVAESDPKATWKMARKGDRFYSALMCAARIT